MYVVAIPTPVDDFYNPELMPLKNASIVVGEVLKKGDYVVYESTVYPGVTAFLSDSSFRSRQQKTRRGCVANTPSSCFLLYVLFLNQAEHLYTAQAICYIEKIARYAHVVG